MERGQDGIKAETKLQELGNVIKDAQKSLRELDEEVKHEKIDKNKDPIDRAVETLQFASTLIDIPSINEVIKGKAGKKNSPESGVILTRTGIEGWDASGAAILHDRTIIYGFDRFKPEDSSKLPEALRKDWDTNSKALADEKQIIKRLANLSKQDVIKKFQRKIKA